MITNSYINDLIRAEREAGTMDSDVCVSVFSAVNDAWMLQDPPTRLVVARTLLQAVSKDIKREGSPPPLPVRAMVLGLLKGTPAEVLARSNYEAWMAAHVEAKWAQGEEA